MGTFGILWPRSFKVSTLRSDFQKSLDDVPGLQKDAYTCIHHDEVVNETCQILVICHHVEEFAWVCHALNRALKLTWLFFFPAWHGFDLFWRTRPCFWLQWILRRLRTIVPVSLPRDFKDPNDSLQASYSILNWLHWTYRRLRLDLCNLNQKLAYSAWQLWS